MQKRLDARKLAHKTALETYGENDPKEKLAYARAAIAQKDYDATPDGIKALEVRLEKIEDESLRKRLNQAILTRKLQANALSEIRNGRFNTLIDAYASMNAFYERDEMASIIESAREHREEGALFGTPLRAGNNVERYKATINQIESMMKDSSATSELTPEQQNLISKLQEMDAPDSITLEAYENIPRVVKLSKTCLNQQITNVAALQNTSPKIIQAYYDAYREQYKNEYANLKPADQPNPPESWIRGEFHNSGYAKEASSRFAPHDKASMYAMYRLRADDQSIPDYMKQSKVIASIDLETTGLDEKQDRIIEVGVASYSNSGKKLKSYHQLIKPEESFIQAHGIQKKEIHNISAKDLENKPTLATATPAIMNELEGKILLAQNANFEKRWLAQNIKQFSQTNLAVIDSKEVVSKHFDYPSYSLQDISGNLGVAYAGGHRALHDATAAAEVYFTAQKKVRQIWRSKTARAIAPSIKTIPFMSSRWDKR